MPAFLLRRIEKRKQEKMRKTVVTPSDGKKQNSRFGFINPANKRKLPDHLVKRIAERRERRATMAQQSRSGQRNAEISSHSKFQ